MNEACVTEADRVEALLHLMCEELFDQVDQVRALACQSVEAEAGMVVPLQYLLCVLNLPEARHALQAALPAWQTALDQLTSLLDHVEAVWVEDPCGCASLEALLYAPWPVRRPPGPDLRDADVLLALERNLRFGGSWDAFMEWLHLDGSRRHQETIRRIRQLADFEWAHGVDVMAVLSGAEAPRPLRKVAD
ncbi:MAG: hypothetical protein NZ528_03935 [Caldilineales bacterium]|nr:hypothetical protein [Caldilineales bacterium]